MSGSLVVENLSFSYGTVPVLRDVSFAVNTGEHTAVLGPSGSGKSTLLRLFAGFEAPSSGKIWLDGQLLSEAGCCLVPPHQRRLSMVFQDLALWPNLTALDNVLLGLASFDLDRKTKRDRSLEAMRACGLEGLEARKPAALSAGQQQRVALARALAVRPAILLLDEPFSSLDIVLKARLFDEVLSLAGKFSVTLVLVTHDPSEAVALCQQAVVLETGGLRESGRLETLLAQPQSEILREYVRQVSLKT